MKDSKFQILIIGKQPPPIGGVTIHVSRLLEELSNTSLMYNFLDLNKILLLKNIKLLLSSDKVHLHSSNAYLRLFVAIFCWMLNKFLIITYHGNIGRYSSFKNTLDIFSIKLATIPIVINKVSFDKAIIENNRTRLLSAFIPPRHINDLQPADLLGVNAIKEKCSLLFCTNAYNVSYDKYGNEIYRILDLLKIFSEVPSLGLVVSDPSGCYNLLTKQLSIKVTDNVIFLSAPHDFNAVIRECDSMIRFTTTDGDSLSVKEALMAGKIVLASDVVDRPDQVILVSDLEDLKSKLNIVNVSTKPNFTENCFGSLYELYTLKNNYEADHPVV